VVERADAARRAEERIERLSAAYRSILSHYEEIERLSREERQELALGGPLSAVIEALGEKKRIFREIQLEEARVTGDREWWKKIRPSLPSASCQDLLAVLEQVQRRVEATLALESECRSALGSLLAARRPSMPHVSAAAASMAYTQGRIPGEGGA
jgi:hypothetical protein